MAFGSFGEPAYGMTRTFGELTVAQAVARVTETLAAEGFGILSEINVTDTLSQKIGAKVQPYVILGACSPTLALEAIKAEPGIGLVMPCNVVVAELDEGQVTVSIIDPNALFQTIGRSDMSGFADEVRAQLQRALDAV